MNEFTKISLAGVSFNLESNGYTVLEEYIDELTAHYGKEPDGKEIISDIEERIAELLIERKGIGGVITKEDVEQIIAILGRPSQIDEESTNSTVKEEPHIQKRLYRDLNHKVVGGVMSGIASFVKTDPVYIRLTYVAILFLLFYISREVHSPMLFFWGILAYMILWVVMPAAKTISQRHAMSGTPLNIEQIERSNRAGTSTNVKVEKPSLIGEFFSVVGRVIQIIAGFLLIAAGALGIIAGGALLFGVEVVDNVPVISILNYIELGIEAGIIKVAVIVTHMLACILFLYWGFKCCFKFRAPKWKPGLILFVAFVIAAITATTLSLIAAKPYYNHQSRFMTESFAKNYDTLYVAISLPPAMEANSAEAGQREAIEINGQAEEYPYYYKLRYINRLDKKRNNLEYVAYPSLSLDIDDDIKVAELECRYHYFNNSIVERGDERQKALRSYSIKDSLITIYPTVYNSENKFCGRRQTLYFSLPKGCTIKVLDDNLPNTTNYRREYYKKRAFGQIED